MVMFMNWTSHITDAQSANKNTIVRTLMSKGEARMTEQPKLKPCPFCGGEAIWKPMFVQNENRVIGCSKCVAEMNCLTHKQAIQAWNRRAA